MAQAEPMIVTVRTEGLEDLNGTLERLDRLVAEARNLVHEMRKTNERTPRTLAEALSRGASTGQRA